MNKRSQQPIALTIAGSDSGGGAGLQADLKTFAALGVHGTSVITCITAQNPRGVLGVHPSPPSIVARQLEALFTELPPRAVKTGMLYSDRLIRVVADWLQAHPVKHLVVDPVMVATSGARLLQATAIRTLCARLLPQASLVTPNLDEAAILVGQPLRTVDDLRAAARQIHRRYQCAALVKGGHLREGDEAIDILYDGRAEWLLAAPFVRGPSTHGTGCTYSAAIAGYLALGCPLSHAVQMAKNHITQAIAQSVRIARHTALNPFWREAAVSR